MNKECNINDLDLLYEDAKKIINKIVLEQIDINVLKNINEVINNLGEYWRGQDANNQINEIIDIKNSILDIRNNIGDLAIYISKLVNKYCNIDNSKSNKISTYTKLSYIKIEKVSKIKVESQEVFINNDVLNFVTILNNSISGLEEVMKTITKTKNSIICYWTSEDEHIEYITNMFDKCIKNIKNIIKEINNSIKNINVSLDKYNSIMSKMNSITSLNDTNNKKKKDFTPEQKKVLTSIETNLNKNKKVSNGFNKRLVDEVKKDLKNKGILE